MVIWIKTLGVATGCLALSACGTLPGDRGVSAASVVASVRTQAGRSLVISWRVFDALLTAVDALERSGVVKSGSPAALKLATLIERSRGALDSATAALRAGDDARFTQFLTLAQSALAETKAAIGDES